MRSQAQNEEHIYFQEPRPNDKLLGAARLPSHCDLYAKYKPSPEIKFQNSAADEVACKSGRKVDRQEGRRLVKWGTRKMTRGDWRSATNICYLLPQPENKTKKWKSEKQLTSTNIYYLLLPQPENMSKHKTIKKSTGCPKNGANRIFRELLGGQSCGPPWAILTVFVILVYFWHFKKL